MNKIIKSIGLFGTCGNSKWRDKFIEEYDRLGIKYFNPQLPIGTWKPECAEIEAKHLAQDQIILFPVTSETYAIRSLSELGFSIIQAIKSLNNRRFVIIMIDDNVDDDSNLILKKLSLELRVLLKSHIKELLSEVTNLYLVNSLDEMLEVSLKLYDITNQLENII